MNPTSATPTTPLAPPATPPRATCLHDLHVAAGARLMPYADVLLPLQFQGILAEHAATRSSAALFDTCHMGRYRLAGEGVVDALERLVTCPVASLPEGRCRYGLMLNADGGVIDDLVLYRTGATAFLLVANAGTRAQDIGWLRSHLPESVRIVDDTETTAKIDLQGPAAPRIAAALVEDFPFDLRYFAFRTVRFEGEAVLLSRTGYTGEVGFELYLPHDAARRFWRGAMALGAVPAGLGARDTLRLEMGMPLHGHELGPGRCASQSGLDRAIDTAKDFIGRAAVLDPARRTHTLVGLIGTGRSAARAGDRIRVGGEEVGVVTSGSFSPSLGVPIALAYVAPAHAAVGASLAVEHRTPLAMTVHALPLYTQGTARRPLDEFTTRKEQP